MTGRFKGAEYGGSSEVKILSPPAEALSDPLQTLATWPKECAADPTLVEQVTEHQRHAAAINSVFNVLENSGASLSASVETGLVSTPEAVTLYESLTDLLADDESARLALYIPFEFLPTTEWKPPSTALQTAVAQFKESYLGAWYKLLNVHDVRANFMDGDVLEEQYRTNDEARVVKATHLLPALLSRQLISEATVQDILAHTDDPVLRQSLIEGLSAWHDTPPPPSAPPYPQPPYNSERRQEWLTQKQQDEAMRKAAMNIAETIVDEGLTEGLVALMALSGTEILKSRIAVTGLYEAINQMAQTDAKAAAALFAQSSDMLRQLGSTSDETRAHLAAMYRKLYRLHIFNEEQAAAFGVDLPHVAGPFSENLAHLEVEFTALQQLVEKAAVDPELSRYIYPVLTVGGSRVKGYGTPASDIDINVFIKPDVPESEKQQVRSLLTTLFEGYEPIEFWLDKTDGSLTVRNPSTFDAHQADVYWTHSLFTTAWVGAKAAIYELQQQLLPVYFRAGDAPAASARRLYLERLEQDVLQYRLMHTGFERQYPLRSRPHWSYSPAIDGHSVFYDPGYRLVATKLFINTVFLPKITISK
jgi:hypothetical protein